MKVRKWEQKGNESGIVSETVTDTFRNLDLIGDPFELSRADGMEIFQSTAKCKIAVSTRDIGQGRDFFGIQLIAVHE